MALQSVSVAVYNTYISLIGLTMTEATGSIVKWNLHTAFVQANTIKGYRYLDLSGVVLNRVAEHYENFTVEPAGCALRNPKNENDPFAIRFGPDRIWLQYISLDSLQLVVDTAPEWINGIATDIEVTQFSRLALRVRFFTSSDRIVEATARLFRGITSGSLHGMIAEVKDKKDVRAAYGIRVPIDDLIADIHIVSMTTARPAQSPEEYPSDGFIFDVDLYRRAEAPDVIPRRETARFLESANRHVYDLLEKVGYKLLEESHGTDTIA